jgi:hypothetical protein
MTRLKRRPAWTPERALQVALMDAFMGLSRAPRRSRPAEPTPLEHHDIPKLEAAVVVKLEPADILHQEVGVVEPEDKPKDLNLTNAALTNAEHQARWRAAHREESRRQARERMKLHPRDSAP